KGAPGMPEWGQLPIPSKLLREGVSDMVRISDARMSGTSFGTVVLHVVPESKYTRGYGRLFLDHVLQADTGCDFDFLRHRPGEPIEPDPLGLVGGPIGGW